MLVSEQSGRLQTIEQPKTTPSLAVVDPNPLKSAEGEGLCL